MVPVKKFDPYKDLTIAIPSSGRAHNLETLKYVSKRARKHLFLQVPNDQGSQYVQKFPHLKVFCHDPARRPTIAHVRELLIKTCHTRYLMILDDDFKFFHRANPRDWHLSPLSPESFDDMMSYVMREVRLFKIAHASISLRQGNQRVEADWAYNKRYSGILIYDVTQLKDIHLRRVPTQQDFDIAMQLIRKGRPSAICYRYAANEQGGNNAPGGASPYRTLKMQETAARMMVKLHKPFVKLVQKTTKGSWGKGGATRYDIIMYAKKAFDAAQGKFPKGRKS